jgi:chloride channel protein, CIC family
VSLASVRARIRTVLGRLPSPSEESELPLGRWLVFSLMIGIVAGLGAVLLQGGIDWVNRLTLVGLAGFSAPGLPTEGAQLSQSYLSIYRWWTFLLVPTLGGLLSGFIVYTWAPEAEGHGTDAMIRAFHREGGYIRARVPIVKIVASAVTLGTGGSGGREGPIAQIGSGFGAWLATALGVSDYERRLIVVAGAAGGIGAIFRAPLGGALIVCELLYRNMEFEYEAVIPTLLTSVVAYTVYAHFNGWEPMFTTSGFIYSHPKVLVIYLALGVVVAAGGWCYVKVFYGMRDHVFARLPIPRHFRPAVGGLLTGLLGLLAPQAIGLGYGWIQMGILDQLTLADYLRGALGKILATACTISSGGSGGVFGPAVVIGGFAGGAVGTFFSQHLPGWDLHTGNFILVGMAAFFGGAAKAPIGAILMISEMTAGYGLLVPLMLSTAIAVVLVPKRVSIYEEQVDGSVNSPAHFDRYLRHVLKALRTPAPHPEAIPDASPTAGREVAFLEGEVSSDSAVVGKRLGEVRLGDAGLAVAIRRGPTTIVPTEGTTLLAGDRVVFIVKPGRAEEVLAILGTPAA